MDDKFREYLKTVLTESFQVELDSYVCFNPYEMNLSKTHSWDKTRSKHKWYCLRCGKKRRRRVN